MARRKPDALPHIVLNIETKRPIELGDFVSAFSSIASQYEKFVRSDYPELASDAKIYVREVRAGSIEADLIPWATQGLSAVVNVIEQVQIVEKFVRNYGAVLGKYLGGAKEPEATRSDLKDFMGAVVAIANDPNGHATLKAVVFEDGKKKVRAALSFDTTQAREAQPPEFYHYLLEEIEKSLLAELRKVLNGTEADKADLARATDIMKAVAVADAERAKDSASAADQHAHEIQPHPEH